MLWFAGLVALYIVMVMSDKLLGNPVAFVGLAFVGFCVALLLGVVKTAMGL